MTRTGTPQSCWCIRHAALPASLVAGGGPGRDVEYAVTDLQVELEDRDRSVAAVTDLISEGGVAVTISCEAGPNRSSTFCPVAG